MREQPRGLARLPATGGNPRLGTMAYTAMSVAGPLGERRGLLAEAGGLVPAAQHGIRAGQVAGKQRRVTGEPRFGGDGERALQILGALRVVLLEEIGAPQLAERLRVILLAALLLDREWPAAAR